MGSRMANGWIHHHLLLLLFLVLSPLLLFPVGGQGPAAPEEEKQQQATPIERAIGITGLTSRWDAIRDWVNLAWINLYPPASGRSESSVGEVMKDAATKSFERSKETMEQAASSAARVAGEAVEKTKETVKRTVSMSGNQEHHDDDAEL